MSIPRVLLVQRVFPPYRLKLFEALSGSRAFELDIAYGDPSRHSSIQSVDAPAGIRAIRLRNFYLGSREMVTYQAGLAQVLRRQRYDVVIAEFNPRIVSNVLACFCSRGRTRFIWWGHGIGPHTGAAAARIRLRLANLGSAVIFYDRRQADALVSLGLPAEKVYIAPNSIDVLAVERHRARAGFDGRRDILFIGRLTSRKRVDVLLRAYAMARDALPPDTRLTIIGDGPERAALTDLAERLDLTDAVSFVGAVYREDGLARYFNSAFVSVCVGDVGLGAIHSLAFGVPMIVSSGAMHGPEIAALRDGETATFLEFADPVMLARALIAMGSDRDAWTRMNQLCVAAMEGGYGIDAMVQSFERAITGV